jgi:hypothetical protein
VAESEECLPGAQLMESMRAVGYSIETAIADIIDNSISAGATNIEIDYSMEVSRPFLSILDDGSGMSPASARDAMKLAGIGATALRPETDLGRFGLGLKTASLSQCRRLTVLTKQPGSLTGLVWDLDHIASTNRWDLLVLEKSEMAMVPGFQRLDSISSGTLVVWENFDRMIEQTSSLVSEFDDQIRAARDHLALIFHQYLNGDHPYPKVAVSINGVRIEGLDPFLTSAKKTQSSPTETISIEGTSISVKAYTLPYLANMSAKQRQLAQIPGSLRDSQGFYIYRGGRLVIWGTWFRLLPKSEGGKLARVKVEIPNSLDHLWSLDIKKSSAVPPVQVRDKLRKLATTLAAPSDSAIKFRGRKIKQDDDVVRVWDVIEDRETFRHQINRGHPALLQLQERLDSEQIRLLESALELIEVYFPSQDLANRQARDQVPAINTEDNDESVQQSCLELWKASKRGFDSPTAFIAWITSFEPWNSYAKSQDVLVALLNGAPNGEGNI